MSSAQVYLHVGTCGSVCLHVSVSSHSYSMYTCDSTFICVFLYASSLIFGFWVTFSPGSTLRDHLVVHIGCPESNSCQPQTRQELSTLYYISLTPPYACYTCPSPLPNYFRSLLLSHLNLSNSSLCLQSPHNQSPCWKNFLKPYLKFLLLLVQFSTAALEDPVHPHRGLFHLLQPLLPPLYLPFLRFHVHPFLFFSQVPSSPFSHTSRSLYVIGTP